MKHPLQRILTVIGLVLLLLALQAPWVRAPIQAGAEVLLANLSLLFVPIGVGVITHLELVSRYGVRVMVVIVLSTWIGLVVTALVLRAVLPSPTSTNTNTNTPQDNNDA